MCILRRSLSFENTSVTIAELQFDEKDLFVCLFVDQEFQQPCLTDSLLPNHFHLYLLEHIVGYFSFSIFLYSEFAPACSLD